MWKSKKVILAFILILSSYFLSALTVAEMKDLPSKKTQFYGGTFSNNLFEKIRVLEGNAADYIADFDEYYEYKNHILSDDEKELFSEYFSYLPQKIQDCFLDNVYSIYFVEGMWYGGLTNFIYNENQKMYCILYLNPDTFHINLTEWLEKRDNTIFIQTDDKNKIKTECSDTYMSFLHVLTHEAAHVYDYINNITPYMDYFDGEEKSDSVFYQNWATRFRPVEKYRNDDLSKFSYYYFGNQIELDKAEKLIKYLNKTPFSTLYGAKNYLDDFAETVTFYWFKKKFNINYKMTYIKNGKEKAVYNLNQSKNVHFWDDLCKQLTGL